MSEYKKFYYTYQDISELLGISISRVRHLVADKTINPTLTSIFKYKQIKRDKTHATLNPNTRSRNMKNKNNPSSGAVLGTE